MDAVFSHVWEGTLRRLQTKWNKLIRKRELSFLSIHYLYIMGMTLAGSIILSATGMAYIDALFFCAGSSTQSGLNSIDLNLLNTAQQVTIYMIGNITSVIFINTVVVFVRLYWFEKRFQHVVIEAMNIRRTKSRAPTETKDMQDVDPEKHHRKIDRKDIVVMSNSGRFVGHTSSQQSKLDPESSNSSEPDNIENTHSVPQSSHGDSALANRNITFADNLASPTRNKTQEEHLTPGSSKLFGSFLEKQRNQNDTEVLRIPGPRESDRGQKPEAVDHGDLPDTESSNVDRHIKVDTSNSAARYRARAGSQAPPLQNAVSQNSQISGLRAMRSSTTNLTEARSVFNRHDTTNSKQVNAPYLSWQPTIGRNSAFVDLTEEQREELGGIEYRSLKLLAAILIAYFLGFHIFGIISFLPWILKTEPWSSIVIADGQSRVWWGIFTPATLFNDLGFTLTPDSFISFQDAVWPLLLGSFLIVIGNTGFPCLLRFIIWVSSLYTRRSTAIWEELRFLLDHPRRCFTLLFPSSATWVLFLILIVLNGLDLLFFIVLDLNDPTVTSLPPGLRVLAGIFQAVSTRTSGTAVVDLANLHPGIQVSYLIMMYISVFPIAISVRRTNVYEEKSLGIYGREAFEGDEEHQPSYIGAHLRRQLSFDLWFIFLGLFIIAVAEGGPIMNDPGFSLFAVLFEIVSAYGTVGLSLGYPNTNASLSAQFSVVSKLVIVAMMIRGRHRGLPYELDRAILLPSDHLHRKDEDAVRRNRRASNISDIDIRRAADDGLFDRIIEEHLQRQATEMFHGLTSSVPHVHKIRDIVADALASITGGSGRE